MNRLNARQMLARLGLGASAMAAGLAVIASPAFAQEAVATANPSSGGPAASGQPSTSAMTNLVRLLVQNKVISQEAADALTRQAEAEAAQAHAVQAPPTADQMAALPPPAPGAVRVAYVPESVKAQIRDEVRASVMEQVKHERWAVPEALPEWIDRIEWTGDLRVRDQQSLYGDGNIGSGGQLGQIDYNAFNANGPFDIDPATNPAGVPVLNTTRNRNASLLRARLGVLAHVSDQVEVGVRLATGSTNSPVSTNQSFGGGLSKKDLWLDQAYVSLRPTGWAAVTLGRMANPFLSTDLVYDDDLNFDGAAGRLAWGQDEGFGVQAVLGAFPLEYLSDGFPSNSAAKAPDRTKWLFAAQLEGDWRSERFNVRAGAAYYDFHGTRGRLSEPCFLYLGDNQCSADASRPAFMQKGNTLFQIRDIIGPPGVPDFAQPQFVGLSMDYKLLNLTGSLDWAAFGPYHLTVTGDYVRNLAYNVADVCRYAPLGLPVNNVLVGLDGGGVPRNFDPCDPAPAGGSKAEFQSGPTGWMVKAGFGWPKTRDWGQWNVAVGYKYLEPDAVLDAYTDSDFHLGGTNAQGYFISGSLGLFKNTWLTARYLSANEIFGPPLQIDVAQVDLNIAF